MEKVGEGGEGERRWRRWEITLNEKKSAPGSKPLLALQVVDCRGEGQGRRGAALLVSRTQISEGAQLPLGRRSR